MSNLKNTEVAPSYVLTKNVIRILPANKNVMKNVKIITKPLVQTKIVHISDDILITNSINTLSKEYKTKAKICIRGKELIRTSDRIISVIGQKNYEIVFTALCSVADQDLKVQSLLALLSNKTDEKCVETFTSSTQTENRMENVFTNNEVKTSVSTQTDIIIPGILVRNEIKGKISILSPSEVKSGTTIMQKQAINMSTQTENYKDLVPQFKKCRKRIRKKIRPYVVKDYEKEIKKCVIYPDNMRQIPETNGHDNLPELRDILKDIDANNLTRSSSFSNLSVLSGHTDEIPSSEITESIIRDIINHTGDTDKQLKGEENVQTHHITLFDGSQIMLRKNPEDSFHVAVPEILKDLSADENKKLMLHQSLIDAKLCLQRNEDNYLPIHVAVLNSDIHLLRRQCFTLKKKQESIDITCDENLTPLHLALKNPGSEVCVPTLLKYGADVLVKDDNEHSAFHMAAENESSIIEMLVEYARNNARKILKDNDLYDDNIDVMSDSQASQILFDHISKQSDNQGYTPLMLASKTGKIKNLEVILNMSPHLVNLQMPTSGNTALHVAVEFACQDADDRNNKSKISDDYKQTIVALIKYGADVNLDNYSGSNVMSILSEVNNNDLSAVVNETLTSVNMTTVDLTSVLVTDVNSTANDKVTKTNVNIIIKKEDKMKNEASKPDIKIKSSNLITNTNKKRASLNRCIKIEPNALAGKYMIVKKGNKMVYERVSSTIKTRSPDLKLTNKPILTCQRTTIDKTTVETKLNMSRQLVIQKGPKQTADYLYTLLKQQMQNTEPPVKKIKVVPSVLPVVKVTDIAKNIMFARDSSADDKPILLNRIQPAINKKINANSKMKIVFSNKETKTASIIEKKDSRK